MCVFLQRNNPQRRRRTQKESWDTSLHVSFMNRSFSLFIKWLGNGDSEEAEACRVYRVILVLRIRTQIFSVYALSRVWIFETPRIVAHQAPPFMRFSRQEYWSGLPFPSPRTLPQPKDQTNFSCIAGRFFTVWATREAHLTLKRVDHDLEGSICILLWFLYVLFLKQYLVLSKYLL